MHVVWRMVIVLHVVCLFYSFEIIPSVTRTFAKYFKESCLLGDNEQFSFNIFQKIICLERYQQSIVVILVYYNDALVQNQLSGCIR